MWHENASCAWVMSHTSVSHVTYELYPIAIHVNRTWLKKKIPWISHITHINESCHVWIVSNSDARQPHLIEKEKKKILWMSHVKYEWVMLHISMSHVTYKLYPIAMHVNRTWLKKGKKNNPMNQSCDMWTSHVTHITESCHIWIVSNIDTRKPHLIEKKIILWMSHVTCEWVMSHISMSHVTYELYPIVMHVNRTWLKKKKKKILSMSHVKYERVMSHTSISHITYELYPIAIHVNLYEPDWKTKSHEWVIMPHHTYQWVMSHISMSQVSHMNPVAMQVNRTGLFRETQKYVGQKEQESREMIICTKGNARRW